MTDQQKKDALEYHKKSMNDPRGHGDVIHGEAAVFAGKTFEEFIEKEFKVAEFEIGVREFNHPKWKAWMGTTARRVRDGEIFLNPRLLGISEEEALMCCAFDGQQVFQEDGFIMMSLTFLSSLLGENESQKIEQLICLIYGFWEKRPHPEGFVAE